MPDLSNILPKGKLKEGESVLPKANAIKSQFNTMKEQMSTQFKKIEDFKGTGIFNVKDVNDLEALLNNAMNLLSQGDEISVEPPSEIEDVPEDNKLFVKYYARLEASRTALSDPAEMARLAHNVHIEHVYLRILNGQIPVGVPGVPETAEGCDCNTTIALTTPTTETLRFREKDARGNDAINEAGQRLLANYLYTDAKRQQEVHLLTLQTEQLMKLMYLQQETELLDSMLEQQDALVRGLSDWSDYLDQQTHEYVEMYEKMGALISTQRRKSSFTVRDIQSLERWTYWSKVVFWILLASCGVMVVVHNYSAVSQTAEQIDAGLGRLRNAVVA